MTDTLNIRLNRKGGSLTLTAGSEVHQTQMQADIKALGQEWFKHIDMGVNAEVTEGEGVEFILQSTLDYIDALEGVLERLQGARDTSDELRQEIEKLLR